MVHYTIDTTEHFADILLYIQKCFYLLLFSCTLNFVSIFPLTFLNIFYLTYYSLQKISLTENFKIADFFPICNKFYFFSGQLIHFFNSFHISLYYFSDLCLQFCFHLLPYTCQQFHFSYKMSTLCSYIYTRST